MNDPTAVTRAAREAWVSGVVEPEVKRRFRVLCATNDQSMSERINELILADLEEND